MRTIKMRHIRRVMNLHCRLITEASWTRRVIRASYNLR